MSRIVLVMVAACLVTGGCGGDEGVDLPPLENVQRLVIIGDSAANAPAHSRGFASLLMQNDDTRFPSFAGADLTSLLPGIQVTRLDSGGDSYHALDTIDPPVGIDTGDSTPAMVVVQLGTNDMLDMVIKIVLDPNFLDDPKPLTDALREQVKNLLAFINDPAVFSTQPYIIVVGPVDPSDDSGDLGEIARMFYPALNAITLEPEFIGGLITDFIGILRSEARAANALFVDSTTHFYGHGYHHAETDHAHYDSGDPSIWIRQLFEPNYRGAHELRRVVWNAIADTPITELPPALTEPDDSALPIVPVEGWANAVVESDVTESFVANDREWVNIATDPLITLGEPGTGANDGLALGLVGGYVILDLGEGEEAYDGDGDDLVVMEFGPLTSGAPEPYRVSVANDPAGPFIPLADARGERAFDIASTGLAMVRYVKVESQAHIPDVMSGLGSPFYPGPEINSIGAVYPGGVGP